MQIKYFIPLLIFAILMIFLLLGLNKDPTKIPSVFIGRELPNFNLPTIYNKSKKLTNKQLYGQYALLNIWASWCESCRQEQLFLLNLKQKNINIYGINYKDNIKNAKQWLQKWGNPFKLIGVDINGDFGINLGVYGVPETFLIDNYGIILYRHLGVLTPAIWRKEFSTRIKN